MRLSCISLDDEEVVVEVLDENRCDPGRDDAGITRDDTDRKIFRKIAYEFAGNGLLSFFCSSNFPAQDRGGVDVEEREIDFRFAGTCRR